jgi:hypothetical protein
MPCYQVQTCNVELNNADHKLLGKALEKLGYKVVRDRATGQILSFTKGGITGQYDGKQLKLSARVSAGLTIDTDAIKREYARQVIMKKVNEAQSKGWDVTKEGQEWVFRKPQRAAAKVYA